MIKSNNLSRAEQYKAARTNGRRRCSRCINSSGWSLCWTL